MLSFELSWFSLGRLTNIEKLGLKMFPYLWIWAAGTVIYPPSKSLLSIQVSPNWFRPKGESDFDAGRYRYISTRKYTHRQIQICTNRQIQYKCVQIYSRYKCGDVYRLVQIFWQADWRLDAALTDLGIGGVSVCVCATLCLARQTGFVFFFEIWFVSMKNPICHNT